MFYEVKGPWTALIACVLTDVGGTLWPGNWAATEALERERLAGLQAALPHLSPSRCVEFHRYLLAHYWDCVRHAERTTPRAQVTRTAIREAAHHFALPADASQVEVIRAALCPSPRGHLALFPGARELLVSMQELGLRCVAVSNAMWRDACAYRRDFAAMGIEPYVDAVVSSVDVGFRKPHRAMFDAALAAAHRPPQHCVMIGNSEQSDIQPALALGMRTLLVALEKPKPPESAAHAVVDSLYDAAVILRHWVATA